MWCWFVCWGEALLLLPFGLQNGSAETNLSGQKADLGEAGALLRVWRTASLDLDMRSSQPGRRGRERRSGQRTLLLLAGAHTGYLLLVLQLFRSARCPARPAAQFRLCPGSRLRRAMYDPAHIVYRIMNYVTRYGTRGVLRVACA